MTERPRCVVADDHPGLIAAISAYLDANGFEVVAAVPDGLRAVAAVESACPELALVDLRMPHLAGLDLVTRLVESAPDTKVAIYTADADAELAQEALAAGADAVVLKEAPLPDLARALNELLRGRRYVDPALSTIRVADVDARAASLTDRERQVLALLADGLQHEQIGARLGIGAETVRTHVRKAETRLGAGTRTEAVATALRLGLIP